MFSFVFYMFFGNFA